jgi:hypothetical protein
MSFGLDPDPGEIGAEEPYIDPGFTCSVCGLWDDERGEVEFYRVRETVGSPRTICDACIAKVGPFAEYEVFVDEVPWVLRVVGELVPGRRVVPETEFVDASALVRLRIRSVPLDETEGIESVAAT